MITVLCAYCFGEILKYPSEIKEHNFCSPECAAKHRSKKYNPYDYVKKPHLSALNEELNHIRMTDSVRQKLRDSHLGKGEGKAYTKIFGRHTHRVVAEEKLGRALLPGEVVHHKDTNRLNNDPDNLRVFPSQKEHARWHKNHAI